MATSKKTAAKAKPATTKVVTIKMNLKKLKQIEDDIKKFEKDPQAFLTAAKNNSDLCKYYAQYGAGLKFLVSMFSFAPKVTKGIKIILQALDTNCDIQQS